MSPQRIQRKRTRGWRMPDGAVYVGRPSRWCNPFVLGKAQIRMPGADGSAFEYEGRLHKTSGQRHFFCTGTDDVGMPVGVWHQVEDATREQVIELFRRRLLRTDPEVAGGPSVDEILAELGGRDLACWCPLDQPCHADVLLELANGGDHR